MRHQVEANQLRIEVLERENDELRKTLSKVSPHHAPSVHPAHQRIDTCKPIHSSQLRSLQPKQENAFSPPVSTSTCVSMESEAL